MAHGHPDAWEYTVGMIWEESRIVQDRLDAERRIHFQLMQITISTIPAMDAIPELVKSSQELFDRIMNTGK